MKLRKIFTLLSTLVILTSMIGVLPAGAASQSQSGPTPFVRQISSTTSVTFPSVNSGPDINGAQLPEIPNEIRAGEAARPQSGANHALVNRSKSFEDVSGPDHHGGGPLTAPVVKSSKVLGSNPGLFNSFDGLNARNQRLANGGNQFTVEPPDQGLCAGNGFVMESVNDVLRVFDTTGNPLTGVIDLNSFYGYPAQFNRTTGQQGPFVTDPSCYYDTATQRWFQVVLTLDVDPSTGDFTGPNHIDIAVSTSSDPTGSWVIYRLPVQDDGTDGTPNHGCSLGPCIGDYPHIGADKYGFYVTTNEYSLFGPEFHAAQIYAFSKSQLAANASSVTVVQFDTVNTVQSSLGTQPGFTVWPAEAPAGMFNTKNNGTEFFLSSNAAEEANGVAGGSFSNELIVWAIINTKSLNSSSPNPQLSNDVMHSEVYGIPPQSDQKPGDFPLGQCINDTTTPVPTGTGCWTLFFTSEPAHDEVISHIDSNDTRMQQVWYAQNRLWGALDTVVNVNGQQKAGIAYFVVEPKVQHGNVDGSVDEQDYLALKNNNVTYPAITVLPNGKGVMAFSLMGQDYHPSSAYVSIKNKNSFSDIHVAALGVGVDDGFTSYKAFVGDPPRTRWGDYSAAATDGSNIWFATEYIGQTCTLAQYLTPPIGSCGGTRVTLANWGTRISGVTP